MDPFTEHFDKIVKDNQSELIGLLTCMHQLAPAFQAFSQLCKDNGIKGPRGRGRYKKAKRPASAYNLFTKDANQDPKVKKIKVFKDRSKKIGQLWRQLQKKDPSKYEEYQAQAKKLREEKEKPEPELEPIPEIKEDVDHEVEEVKVKKDRKKPAKGKGKKVKKEEIVIEEADSEVDDLPEVSDDDVFDSDSE
jgi:hypothetical protein